MAFSLVCHSLCLDKPHPTPSSRSVSGTSTPCPISQFGNKLFKEAATGQVIGFFFFFFCFHSLRWCHRCSWRDGSAVRSTCYSCRGLEFESQPLSNQLTVTCNSSSRGPDILSWPPGAPISTCTYKHADIHIHIKTKNKLKTKKLGPYPLIVQNRSPSNPLFQGPEHVIVINSPRSLSPGWLLML